MGPTFSPDSSSILVQGWGEAAGIDVLPMQDCRQLGSTCDGHSSFERGEYIYIYIISYIEVLYMYICTDYTWSSLQG